MTMNAVRNRRWRRASRTQDVKEHGLRRRPGKSGLPINGGAARPEHLSRSAAQRKMGFHAVGV